MVMVDRLDTASYLRRFREKLSAFYLKVRDYEVTDPVLAKDVEAFMEAGLCLSAVSKSELEQVIAQEHQSVFGMGLRERSLAAKQYALEKGDFSFFDLPTWRRAPK